MTVKQAEKNFVAATRAYIEQLKMRNADSMRGAVLEGFIDGWSNEKCKFSYEENEYYNLGYGPGENHLIP